MLVDGIAATVAGVAGLVRSQDGDQRGNPGACMSAGASSDARSIASTMRSRMTGCRQKRKARVPETVSSSPAIAEFSSQIDAFADQLISRSSFLARGLFPPCVGNHPFELRELVR